jgi:hypothetical protein
MIELGRQQYSNGRHIRTFWLSLAERRKLGIHPDDTVHLAYGDEDSERTLNLRPDEALMVITLLAKALQETCTGFETGIKRSRQ